LPPISSSGNGDLAPHFILFQDQTAERGELNLRRVQLPAIAANVRRVIVYNLHRRSVA
jgi:hypothetical protein